MKRPLYLLVLLAFALRGQNWKRFGISLLAIMAWGQAAWAKENLLRDFRPDRAGWREVGPDFSSSPCIGDLSTPVCALESMMACIEWKNRDLCVSLGLFEDEPDKIWEPPFTHRKVEGETERYTTTRFRILDGWKIKDLPEDVDHEGRSPDNYVFYILFQDCSVTVKGGKESKQCYYLDRQMAWFYELAYRNGQWTFAKAVWDGSVQMYRWDDGVWRLSHYDSKTGLTVFRYPH